MLCEVHQRTKPSKGRSILSLERLLHITFYCTLCRAFLAWRRGVELADGQEVAARDGELKTDWTEPRPERRSMGIEWRPSGSRRWRRLQSRPGPGRPSGTPDDGAGCTGFGWHRCGDRHRQARVRVAGRQQPTRGRVAASLSARDCWGDG